MRSNNQYIIKVLDELDVYRKHMLDETELLPKQKENFEKLNVIRTWLCAGYSDTQVLALCKTDPAINLQDRRARELLAIAYEIFADIRIQKNEKGVKAIYAEVLNTAAREVFDDYQKAIRMMEYGDAAKLMREFRGLKQLAGQIEGVFLPDRQDIGEKKRPQKVVIKSVTVNNYGDQDKKKPEDTTYELQ